VSAVRAALELALRCYADRPRAVEWLGAHLARLDEPVRVAVAGPPGSGRTTLVEALRREPKRALPDLTLLDGGPPDNADAVLCLIRGRRPDQLDAFEPACTIAVLGRTDEAGGGSIDALTTARATARRYRRDPELAAQCQDVVPVCGIVALAGRTLTPEEFTQLNALAQLPRPNLDALLLSTDRFLTHGGPAARPLLDRLGLFGVRLATTLIRTGFDDAARLPAELLRRSGLPELRDAVRVNFADRAETLKARSALAAVESVLRQEPGADPALNAMCERAGIRVAHELRELRLLAWLRAGDGEPFGEELAEEAVRLVGGYGTSATERLGTDAVPRHTALQSIDRWRALAEDPDLPVRARHAATVVVRSCEGMLYDTLDG
jgi:hypothetical protein